MVTLHEVLKDAKMEGAAIGHFNVSDLVTLKAAISDRGIGVGAGFGFASADETCCPRTMLPLNPTQDTMNKAMQIRRSLHFSLAVIRGKNSCGFTSARNAG
jgi:hypothetical protein